jgi:predicted lipoprotein
MTRTPFSALSIALFSAAILAGCAAPQPSAPVVPGPAASAAPTQAALLNDVARNIILPTYQALDDQAATLQQAVTALQQSPTEGNLATARAAWQAARLPWELSESHLLGPVKDQDLDPALDSWPVDASELDKVLASDAQFDQAFIAVQQPTLKGFHVIEYVLFGNQPAGLSARKLTYLAALTADFKATTSQLRQAWDPESGNFLAQYAQPAAGGAFGSTDVAFAETLQAMAEICEEVANGKIEVPLAAKDGSLEESHFSGNSLADFQANMTGVQNVYLGIYGSREGLGLTHLIAAKDPALDFKLRGLINQALADLRAVPGTFGTAIAQNPEALRKAQASINALRIALQQDVSLMLTGKAIDDAT